jgi:hypothetical protein
MIDEPDVVDNPIAGAGKAFTMGHVSSYLKIFNFYHQPIKSRQLILDFPINCFIRWPFLIRWANVFKPV